MLYRKKPVEVEAIRWLGHNWDDINDFVQATEGFGTVKWDSSSHSLFVDTPVARRRCAEGDWLICERVLYTTCNDEEFVREYERISIAYSKHAEG
jgi:hypothetical protein